MRAERVVVDTGDRTARPPVPGSAGFLSSGPKTGSRCARCKAADLAWRKLNSARNGASLSAPRITGDGPSKGRAPGRARRCGCRQPLEKDGCQVDLDADVQRVEATRAGIVVHRLAQTVEGTHLFLAVGRQPYTNDLGLEAVRVKPDEHPLITVNDRLGAASTGSGQLARFAANRPSPMRPVTIAASWNHS